MTKRPGYAAFISGACALFLVCCATLSAQQCGVERWSVKTGTDPNAGSINLASATPTTVASLVALSAPQPIPVNGRVSPTETTLWTIDATLTSFKLEGDSDYHLVIADPNGNTMIAEIPSPNCVAGNSPFNSLISQARAKFDAALTASSSFQDVSIPVRLTGVGMFDFLHGQRGVAANGIEIHPITDVVFNPGTDFSLSASQTLLTLTPGSSGTLSFSVSAVGTAGPAVSMSASGTPQGIAIGFSPNPVAVSSSTTATVSVDASTTPGNYPVTITGTDGSLTHTASIIVNVSATATPDFSVSAAPKSVAIGIGGSNVVSVSTAPTAGFSGDVSLSVSGLPQGISGSFSNTTIPAPGAGSSTLTITADTTALAGTATITILASGSGTTHSATLNVTVCSGAAVSAPTMRGIASIVLAKSPGPQVASKLEVEPVARDEDDSPVEVVPTPSALLRARRHGEVEICHPRVHAVFLGHGWTDASHLSLKNELAKIKVSLIAPICNAGGRNLWAEKTLGADGPQPSTLSDLQIQARLVDLLQGGMLKPPTEQTIFVLFLAPEIGSTLGSSVGGQDYFAYGNHFHAFSGEIRYIVVPFNVDPKAEVQAASRAILRALIAQ